MRRRTYAVSAALAIAAAGLVLLVDHFERAPTSAQEWTLLERYCFDCHNRGEFAGGLALDTRSPAHLHSDAEVWEKVLRKLRGGQMPPVGEPSPAPEQLAGFVSWLESSLDAAAAADPNPGAPILHRLNRNEYANAVRDLLDLRVDPATLLPSDDSSGGFDNIANALSVSPALMQAYVTAAAKISRLAVGDPTVSAGLTTYAAPRGLSQAEHLEGLPLGTRGGLLIDHVFPLDADYELTIRRAGGGFGLETVGADEDVEVTLNGRRIELLSRKDPRTFRVAIPAGPQRLGVAIVREQDGQGVDDLYSVLATVPGIQSVSIMGPFDATGPGDTPSRRRLFVCRPETPAEETPCAGKILRTLATRAFRRPVEADDPSLATLMTFYADGSELRGFEAGIQYALARVLVDPEFVFRFEAEPQALADGAIYRIGDFELATRLSFFLWSSIPDDELLDLAAAGTLGDRDVLEGQVRRMLADPKADALVENFASQWLMLRQLETVRPVSKDFDENLRQAFAQETRLLFATVLHEDRSIVDLLDADYTFVDERLARHYGIPNVRGSRFRRIALEPTSPRRGLLGQGSLLTVTSAPNRTSPVKRGAWVLENILGTPPPPPPEGVERNLDQTAAITGKPRSTRDRLEQHRADPACASCHAIMDPIGFALENFDAVGAWRESDGGVPVEAGGEFVDGTPLAGPATLRDALLARREMFVTAATRKLLTYALGRETEYYDMPAVRAIVRGAAADDYRLSSLVLGIVNSVPFTMKRKIAAGQATDTGA